MNEKRKVLLTTAMAGLVAAGLTLAKTVPAFADTAEGDKPAAEGKAACKGKDGCKGHKAKGKGKGKGKHGKAACKGKDGCKGKGSCKAEAGAEPKKD